MKRELRGKVKLKLWVRPTCTDDSDGYRNGQKAHQDFRAHAHEDGPVDVIAPDVLAEILEIGDEPIDPEPWQIEAA